MNPKKTYQQPELQTKTLDPASFAGNYGGTYTGTGPNGGGVSGSPIGG